MQNFREAYDAYGDFQSGLYFSLVFKAIPSTLELEIPMKKTKENIEKVLALIDVEKNDLEFVYKNWHTLDYRNTEISTDFPNRYLFKSKTSKLLIWVELSNTLYIEFLYDANDRELEEWVLATNHKARKALGEIKLPSFKVLTKGKQYETESVSTNGSGLLNYQQLYNDDFQEINSIIFNALEESRSGLILLHGKPGTGKTTYIKSLIASFRDKDFIFIQNDFVNGLLQPDFISFLLKNKNCILIVEDAEKVVKSRDTQDASVVSTILQLTDGLFSDYLNIKVICTFNSDLKNIDKALLRKGRMIARYEFKDLCKEKTNLLLQELGHPALDKAMPLAEIYRLKDKTFAKQDPRKIGF